MPDEPDAIRERQRAVFTERALWEVAAERVERIACTEPDLTATQVLERLRDEVATASAEHERLVALEQ